MIDKVHKPLRAGIALFAMFALALGLILIARSYLTVNEDGLASLLGAVKASPVSLPIIALIFTAAAFLGVPQWALIAATIIAFGPVQGGVYSWLSTMVSASVDFWAARRLGAAKLESIPGEFLEHMVQLVRKNGLLASFAVRLVPTGPFVLVNMAAGVSGLGFGAFIAGTGAGIIPKILVVALLAQGVLTPHQGKAVMVFLVLGIALVLGAMFLARRILSPVVKAPSRED